MAFLDATDRRQNLAGCAITALEGVVVDEGMLHGMQFAVWPSQSLDRRDLTASKGYRERQTGKLASPVDQHRAGSALPMVAALLGSGQRDMLAQCIEEAGAHVDGDAMGLSIDLQLDRDRRVDIAGDGVRCLRGRRAQQKGRRSRKSRPEQKPAPARCRPHGITGFVTHAGSGPRCVGRATKSWLGRLDHRGVRHRPNEACAATTALCRSNQNPAPFSRRSARAVPADRLDLHCPSSGRCVGFSCLLPRRVTRTRT